MGRANAQFWASGRGEMRANGRTGSARKSNVEKGKGCDFRVVLVILGNNF